MTKKQEEKELNEKFKDCLKGLDYPASKDEMIKHVQTTCGAEDVVSALKKLPDQTVSKFKDLTDMLPGIHLKVDI